MDNRLVSLPEPCRDFFPLLRLDVAKVIFVLDRECAAASCKYHQAYLQRRLR
ncbi:hypothetical protein WP1_310 [Pseudomonas phage WP1]